MSIRALNFLKRRNLTQPEQVDRLLVSAFLNYNGIEVYNNSLLLRYLIPDASREFDHVREFIHECVKDYRKFDFEVLIKFFELVISPEDKLVTGAVYTPINIRSLIINEALNKQRRQLPYIKLADIACGCGGFLVTAAKAIKDNTGASYLDIFENQIFGLDIQEYAVVRTKLVLSLLATCEGEDIFDFNFNIYTGDALGFDWKSVNSYFIGFDIIVGNPPYVCSRHINESTRGLLANWSVCSTGHPDLYIPFFQVALTNLTTGGFIGFITVNSFFKSLNGRALRSYFSENKFKLSIIDFGNRQIFRSKSTYTCICFIEKKESNDISYLLHQNEDSKLNLESGLLKISYGNLNSFKGWNLRHASNIMKIESIGIPFDQQFKTKRGIATLKNDIYIFSPDKEDSEFFYLKRDNELYPIEKGICKDIFNSNKLTVVDDVGQLIKKIIFPYIYEGNHARVISEDSFTEQFPCAYKFLLKQKDVLNRRDKGKRTYEKWYSFGRSQSLELTKHRLFFPHICSCVPNYIINSDKNLLFYNGVAVVHESIEDLVVLKKLMSSSVFWYYILHTSKPYSSGFYSLSRNYLKDFGIVQLSNDERKYVIEEDNKDQLDLFFEQAYNVPIFNEGVQIG